MVFGAAALFLKSWFNIKCKVRRVLVCVFPERLA